MHAPRLGLDRARGRWWRVSAIAFAIVAVAAALPVALGAPVGASATGTAAAPLSLSLSSAPFAERAGYSSRWAPVVAEQAPEVGNVEVELTFNPTSPSFYASPSPGSTPMTMAEIASEFGLSVTEYAAVEQYFEARGLSVVHTWPDRLSLSLSGPASKVGAAFGTTLVSGVYGGRGVSFPANAPSLPAWLEAETAGVAGLSNGFDAFSLPLSPAVAPALAAPSQLTTTPISPSIARDIYDVSGLYNLTTTPTYAVGRGIVLLLWGWGYAPSDIKTFFSQYYPAAFPAPTVTAYPVDGAPSPSPNAVNDPSNGSRELTLDLEWSGSMAPGASLDAVYAPPGPGNNGYSPTSASMIDALNTAVTPSDVPNVAAISMSFGSTDGGDPSLQSGFQNDFAIAAHEGISLFAATGDLGGDAGNGCTGGAAPEYPSTSPDVVAVGGTVVSLDQNPLGGITGFSETGWSLSGGGFSTVYPAPSWQEVGSAAGPISASGFRGVPDVAATASDNFVYFAGADQVGAGTSFATPLWAGMVTEMDALRGSNFGFFTPALYTLAANGSTTTPPAFHDITSGSNCVASAGPGWDEVTGWGSPDAVLLYEHLIATFVTVRVAAGPSPVAPGGAVTITGTVTNSTTGAPLADVPVDVTLTSTGLGGPCSGTFGAAVPVTGPSGEVSATFSVPGCYLGASAQATVTVAGHGYYGVASSSVAVNLLGFAPWLAPITMFPGNVVFFVVLAAVGITIGAVLGRRPPEATGVTAPPPIVPGAAEVPAASPSGSPAVPRPNIPVDAPPAAPAPE